jgi:hypothetical protein
MTGALRNAFRSRPGARGRIRRLQRHADRQAGDHRFEQLPLPTQSAKQRPPYTGKVDVSCTQEGDAIELNVYNATGQSKECTYKIAPQQGIGSVGLQNFGGRQQTRRSTRPRPAGDCHNAGVGRSFSMRPGRRSRHLRYGGGTRIHGF